MRTAEGHGDDFCLRKVETNPLFNTMKKYFIFNATDLVYAHPYPVTRFAARRIMKEIAARYARQGYYSSVAGRIPISALALTLVEAV